MVSLVYKKRVEEAEAKIVRWKILSFLSNNNLQNNFALFVLTVFCSLCHGWKTELIEDCTSLQLYVSKFKLRLTCFTFARSFVNKFG